MYSIVPTLALLEIVCSSTYLGTVRYCGLRNYLGTVRNCHKCVQVLTLTLSEIVFYSAYLGTVRYCVEVWLELDVDRTPGRHREPVEVDQ